MISLEKLLELDFVSVLDLEEKLTTEMNVINAVEYNGSLYMMAADADAYGWDDEEENEEEEAEEAFVFKVCSEKDALYLVTENYSETEVFVTTDFPTEEFNQVAALLSESDNYDLVIEESDDDD